MRPKSWTIKKLIKVTTDFLKEKKIESPRLTAEALLSHLLNINRVTLYLNLDQPLNESEISGYRELIKRRLRREPLQYITGIQEFWSMDFIVDPQVLIPRPESELLIEQAIERFKTAAVHGDHSPRILDLGTGCGALATVLAKEIPKSKIWATDVSQAAINIARINAEKHGVSEKIEFIQGDLWQPLRDKDITFDLIVSNPPYVSAEEYEDLPPEVRSHEPRLALDGREGGFYFIKEIIEGSPNFLNPDGWLLLEMAPSQTDRALELLERIDAFDKKMRIKDYSHRYRVVCAQHG
ncbi:MAG: peptide chain release factor N(5)-glutamine methyltransferase [Deltaproteobacteria bacterium]|nr:peptide chain release factor N(5)-glutamine methyltransferase [Deltaproteobacteria bacterium]